MDLVPVRHSIWALFFFFSKRYSSLELGTGSQVVWYFDGIISEYSIPDLSGSTKEGILKALTTDVFGLEER